MGTGSGDFVTALAAAQPPIYACIRVLLPDRADALDVLQETNLTLWRKRDEFEPGTDFTAWARSIARYHVLNHRRKTERGRLVFDAALLAELAGRQAARDRDADRRAPALRACVDALPARQKALLERRYGDGGSVQRIADEDGRAVGAVSQALYRLREALSDCVRLRLAAEEGS